MKFVRHFHATTIPSVVIYYPLTPSNLFFALGGPVRQRLETLRVVPANTRQSRGGESERLPARLESRTTSFCALL